MGYLRRASARSNGAGQTLDRQNAWSLCRRVLSASRSQTVRSIQLKGGYYPIVYDRSASRKGSELADMKDALSQVAAASRSQNTAKGFLEKRAKKVEGLAITLTLRAAFEGLDAEIHRLAWEEWVVNSGKILKRGQSHARGLLGASCSGCYRRMAQSYCHGKRLSARGS